MMRWIGFAVRRRMVAGLVVGWALVAQPGSASAQPVPQQGAPPVQQQWVREGQNPTPSLDAPPALNAPLIPRPEDGQPAPIPPTAGQSSPSVPPSQGPATYSPPNTWVPAKVAKLQALDKIDAEAKDLTVPVGQSATFGALTITVKACLVRPSDQPEDAAAFLDIQDSHPDSTGFSGWMLQQEPSVSRMQNPIYDLRVIGCA